MNYPYQNKTDNVIFTLSRYNSSYKIVAVNPEYDYAYEISLMMGGMLGDAGMSGPVGVDGFAQSNQNPLLYSFDLNDYMDSERSIDTSVLIMIYPDIDLAKLMSNFKYVKSKMMKNQRVSHRFA